MCQIFEAKCKRYFRKGVNTQSKNFLFPQFCKKQIKISWRGKLITFKSGQQKDPLRRTKARHQSRIAPMSTEIFVPAHLPGPATLYC